MSVVLLERSEGVARITLNRPDQGNGIDMSLANELDAIAREVASDPAVRSVVLTGAGRMFCVGGDIASFAAAGDNAGPFLKDLAGALHKAVVTLAHMDKPLVTVINGPAAGAGFGLAMLGDIVLASEAAHFTAAYTAIGLTPDGGLSWLLPRLVGLRLAQEMILTNRRVGATDAVALGLVTRAVAAEALAAEAQSLAATLAAAPVHALGSVRRLLLDGQTRGLAAQLDAECASIAAAGAGPEGREGVAAFLGKRKPDYRSV